MHLRNCIVPAAALGSFLFLSAIAGVAAAQVSFEQLTDFDGDCGSYLPRASADGAAVVFESDCDLVPGDNEDNSRELFRIDNGVLTQITRSSGCANTNPTIEDDGERVAFESDCDLTGANADRNSEIFVARRNPGNGNITISQVTDRFEACDSRNPSISGDGDYVAFDSDCDLVDGENIDLWVQIFLADISSLATVSFDQLTDDESGLCDNTDAALSRNGSVLAFLSDCDLDGSNEDFALEIWSFTGADTSPLLHRLTVSGDDTCSSISPSIVSDGSLVAFESDCDFTGANGDGSEEIFVVTSMGSVRQLSDDPGTGVCESFSPRIDRTGSVVTYAGFCDPGGDNADASLEVFEVSVSGLADPVQITDAVGCGSEPGSVVISGGMIQSFFDSDCDPVAANSDGSSEIFASARGAVCVCGSPVTESSPPKATDALFVLRGAVGSEECPACACDVNDSGTVVATDALTVLNAAVGLPVNLVCPGL